MRFVSPTSDLLSWAKGLVAELNNLFSSVRSAEDFMQDVGTVSHFVGKTIPDNLRECNGQLLKRNDFPQLFKQIGTTFNAVGDPSDVFRLPDYTSYYLPDAYIVIEVVGKRGTKVPQGFAGY